MDLTTTVGGIKLANPVMPASGPLTGDGAKLLAIAAFGVGAVVTKTISVRAAEVPLPCIYGGRNYVLNAELWSEYAPERWIGDFLPAARKKLGLPLFVSAGYSPDDLESLVPRLEPFADAFEISTHYVGKDPEAIARTVATLKRLTRKPVFIKMSPQIPSPSEFALAVKAGGADGIVVANSFGPALKIDLDRRRALLGDSEGRTWLSGPAVKPLALALVAAVKKAVPDLAVIGTGGAGSADDVIEFLLAGASAVQLLSAALINGKDLFARIVGELPAALEKRGFSSVAEAAATRPATGIRALSDGSPDGRTRRVVSVAIESCTGCGLCERVCPWFAIAVSEGKARVDDSACFGCGLCESRCTARALAGTL
jgi:dihydroorotate dehydrogenase subfamily 1